MPLRKDLITPESAGEGLPASAGARKRLLCSYQYVPWSSLRFCEDALREVADVTFVGSPYFDRPGYADDLDLTTFVSRGVAYDSYIGSEYPLHLGIPSLNIPTIGLFPDYWRGDTFRIRAARLFDHVFVGALDWLDDFRRAGCTSVHWFPFAFDPRFHRDLQMERIYQVAFVGNISLDVQKGRLALLNYLSRKYRMNDFTKRAYLDDLARIYSQSKIVVNIPNQGGFNMRVFEAMACGALVLTEDTGNGQKEFFQENTHLAIYRSRNELVEKIDYFLAHEDERRAIAERGTREVFAKHTYAHRMANVLGILENHRERHRVTDQDEALRIYSLAYSRTRRLDYLIFWLLSVRCSLRTRVYILACIAACVRNILVSRCRTLPK